MKRSTEIAFALVLTALTACGGQPAAIEVPMAALDPDASAPIAIEPTATPQRPTAENAPFQPGARYAGSYWCAQGKTKLTLTVDEVDGDVLTVIFAFDFAGGPGYAAAAGRYSMKGSFDQKGDRLVLHPLKWIEQPAGYTMVDLTGNVSRTGGINGTVGGPGCTTFQVSPEK